MIFKILIIVESPSKVKTLKNLLGSDFVVVASMGSIRDLPDDKLSVNVEHDFAPTYTILPKRERTLAKLRAATKGVAAIYLATDPDREGEAIAWHIAEVLKLDAPRRIRFNEITRNAVQRALANPRQINMNKVNAQQARRVIDRLVGYEISPLLWKKVKRGLSAGRMQSVAVRMIVDREREIEAFKPVAATAAATDAFDVAPNVLDDLRRPAPFITSTLQQEASHKLGFGAKQTMRTALKLYEGIEAPGEGHVGLITFIRTDSTRVCAEALASAREYIADVYGAEYNLNSNSDLSSGLGLGSDGYEAIRPTDVERTPEQVAKYATEDQAVLYELIWRRFLASQMTFDGFLKVYGDVGDAGGDDVGGGFTEPPTHYTEATLIRALEEQGIGRPGTYAAAISTIQERLYVDVDPERWFIPTELGKAVTDLLVKHFPDILDGKFTAEMESKLDGVENGSEDWIETVKRFYEPFHKSVVDAKNTMERVKVGPKLTDQICEKCGRLMANRFSRFGSFLGCSGYPDCRNILCDAPVKVDVPCPKDGGKIIQRRSRKGLTFYGCANYPACDFVSWGKPIGRDCPECGQMLAESSLRGRVIGIKCGNKECGYKEPFTR